MYPASAPNPPATVMQPVPGFVEPQKHSRSPALIIFGCCEICISTLLLLFCIWAAFTKYVDVTGYFGITSGVFHNLLGVASIIGGKDPVRHRGLLMICLVMGIVAYSIFVITTMTLASIQWSFNYNRCQNNCTDSLCVCADFPTHLNTVILLLSFIEFVIDIVLSSLACHNMWHCFSGQNLGQVIQRRPEHANEMMQIYQINPNFMTQQCQQPIFPGGDNWVYPQTHELVNEGP